jgi:hypothetical protein
LAHDDVPGLHIGHLKSGLTRLGPTDMLHGKAVGP